MSNAAPWSVKGIDPRAREAVREAARREGLTIGEWLNQAILANEAALAQARGDTPPAPYEPRGGGRDARLTEALQQLIERVDVNDRRNALALTGLDRTLSAVAARVENAEQNARADDGRVSDLIDELRDAQSVLLEQMRRIEEEELPALQAEITTPSDRLDSVEADLHMLSAKALAAEAETGNALARLDGAMSALDAKLADAVSPASFDAQTAAMRQEFEAKLDTVAQDITSMISEARADIAGQIVSALGGLQPEEMKEALGDMSRRLTAAERRHTQTIEAVSIEIKRLSESMDRRLRVMEARNDDGAAVAEMREQFAAMTQTVENRLGEMETREAAAFSRMGEEVGRIAERLDMRVSNSEARSADAIEKVGEQVALMAERLSAKQDKFATEVAERIVQSEERQTGRLSQALSAISERLGAIEANPGDASPFANAMTAFEARLKTVEARAGIPVTLPEIEPPNAPAYIDPPTPPAPPEPAAPYEPYVRLEHEPDLHQRYANPLQEPETYRRAGPLADPEPAPLPIDESPRETIYLEDIEEEFSRREEDSTQAPAFELPPQTKNLDDPFADIEAAPPEDDEEDLFWSTGKPRDNPPPAAPASPAAYVAVLDEEDEDDFERDETASFGAPSYSALKSPLDDDPFSSFQDDAEEAKDEPLIALSHEPSLREQMERAAEEQELEHDMFGASLDLDAPPAGGNDYLANARRAAQANAQNPRKKKEKAQPKEKAAAREETAPGLRGLTRILLWGAAGVAAAAIAGGVYAFGAHGNEAKHSELDQQDKPSLNAPPGSIAEGAALAAAQDEGVTPPTDAAPLDDAAPAHAGPLDGASLSPSSVGPAAAASAIAASFSTLEDAAMRGDPVAQYEYGLARLAGGDSQNAVVYLRRSANQGLAMAQYRLAKLYERGEGVPVDLTEARKWTERAATAGNRKAMHDLGVYYARGEGAPFDEATAFKWFRQAAEYGVADSQFNLGVLYAQGRGVTADQSEAYYWFSIAAAGGDSDARARAAMIAEKMDPALLAQLRSRATSFRAKTVIARANGDFGKRPWAPGSSMEASAAGVPRT